VKGRLHQPPAHQPGVAVAGKKVITALQNQAGDIYKGLFLTVVAVILL
jgi:hypothetical protein